MNGDRSTQVSQEWTACRQHGDQLTVGGRQRAAHCSERERAATSAEREIDAFYSATLMQKHVGERFPGVARVGPDVIVDLHWALSRGYLALERSFDELMARMRAGGFAVLPCPLGDNTPDLRRIDLGETPPGRP